MSLATVSLVSFMKFPSSCSDGSAESPGKHLGVLPWHFLAPLQTRNSLEIAGKTRVPVFPGGGWPRAPSVSINKKRIVDYPNLASYMRDLYQMPGIAETVKARYYVINYWSIARLNPMGIIPKGTSVDYSG